MTQIAIASAQLKASILGLGRNVTAEMGHKEDNLYCECCWECQGRSILCVRRFVYHGVLTLTVAEVRTEAG